MFKLKNSEASKFNSWEHLHLQGSHSYDQSMIQSKISRQRILTHHVVERQLWL